MNIVIMYFIILIGRIVEMTLGTIKTIFVINNRRVFAAFAALIEILIWVLIIREILNSDTFDLLNVLVYSLGYAIGTIIGSLIEDKLGIGSLTLHILVDKEDKFIIDNLRKQEFGVAYFDATKNNSEKLLLMLEVDRKKVSKVKNMVHKTLPTATITTFSTRSVNNGYFSK